MPFVSDSAIIRVQDDLASKARTIRSLRERMAEGLQVDASIQVFETIGGGIAAGALRAKFEEPNGEFTIGSTPVDVEMAIGLTLVLLGFYAGTKGGQKMMKGWQSHLLSTGAGVLAHYGGQVARNSIKGGSFTTVAGGGLAGTLAGY